MIGGERSFAENVLEPLSDGVLDALAQLEGTGLPTAAIYLDAAARSIRYAAASLLIEAEGSPPTGRPDAEGYMRLVYANGLPSGCRGRIGEDGAWTVTGLARAVGCRAACDLGSALLHDGGFAALVADDLRAALACDSLSGHRWLHVASGEPSWLSRSAAASIVSAVRRGRGFLPLAPWLSRRALCPETKAIAGRLGWCPTSLAAIL